MKKGITAVEISIMETNNNYYNLIKLHLNKVLDFVERYNKQDKEKDIANSAQFLQQLFSTRTQN